MTEELPQLVCIAPERIEEFWPYVAPLIDKAYERFGTKDERRRVEEDIKSGMALVWIAWSATRDIEAALVTDLLLEDGDLVCRLRALSGRMVTRWLRLLKEIEAYAKTEKCKCVRYYGRPGWVAMMRPDYRVTHVQAEKPLRG